MIRRSRARLPRLCPSLIAIVALGVVISACAPRRVAVPSDAGVDLPDASAVHAAVTASCRPARTFTAELGLSGRAGEARLSGRVLAGFERGGRLRLEGLAPFGPPAFILAATPGDTVLLLPRDQRVVRHPDAGAVLGALSGVPMAPDDLMAVLTGCVVPSPTAVTGRLHDGGWASLDLGGGATLYLRRVAGSWQPRAARRDGWDVEYPQWQGGWPREVRLQSRGQAADVTLALTVSQIEANIDLMATVFRVEVPAGTAVLTLNDLRQAGPLRGR